VSTKRWIVNPPDSRATELAAALGLSPIVAGLLIARGYHEADWARAFL